MASIQELIHKFEERGGAGLRLVFVVLVTLGLLVCYNWRGYRNFGTQEAMDAAQVARNIAEGRGFTTEFVRPFSMHLLTKHNTGRLMPTEETPRPDYSQIRGDHPDLANAPVYPLALAAAMKVLPFDFEVNFTDPFWSEANSRLRGLTDEQLKKEPARVFRRYQPDFLISLGNQLLLVVVAVMSFFLARRLFDQAVAWLTYALIIGSEFLWRFSTTGLSTMLLLLIFLSLIWCLVWMENEERDPVWSHRAQTWLAIAIGLLLGLGMMTRYAFGWLLVPVLVYLVLVCALRRWQIFTLVVVMFVLVVTPWIWRNYTVSGTPLGTAGYALVETTLSLPEYRLQRALEPDFRGVDLTTLRYKLVGNLRDILQNELPRLGGSWVTAMFAVGLLLSFRSLALRRLRYFLLGALGVLILVQALGKTQLSVDSPTFNSENLLVLLVPVVFIYGAGFFFLLLDQMNLKVRELRYLVIGAFGVVVSLPMLFVFISPKANPLHYPPYYPATIHLLGKYMKPNELTMSDIPWAVAWYADRQSVWLTPNPDADYYNISDYQKPIRALYLTPVTTDSRILTDWVRPGLRGWPIFVLEFIFNRRAPDRFPLRYAHADFFPEQLLLCDWERWKDDDAPVGAPPREDEPPPKPATTPTAPAEPTP